MHSGSFRVVLATAILLPAVTLAANPDPTLRRSDQVDVRRLGRVSEDERSVLRIEWRAGLAGVEETRSVRDMLDKLQRMETNVGEVSRLIRNMPAQNPAVAATAPGGVEAPDANGDGIRLAAASAAALALVAIGWFRRRKPATRAETGPASVTEKVPPDAASPPTPPPLEAMLATEALTGPPPAETSPGVASAATLQPVAVTPAKPADDAPRSAPATTGVAPAAAPDPGPVASAEPGATTSFNPPDSKSSEAFPANETMIFNFSLDAADPEVVAREHARLPVPPPVSAPQAPRTPQLTNVEPTLQLAEIMLSMGLEQGAAQALIEYTEANPRHAVYHWLKLLGIYRSRGLQKEFAETAEKLRKQFNIQAEEWGKPAEGKVPTLENFFRVSDHVQEIWAQPEECISYLQRLLEDNRDGARAGFPQPVAEEILLLVELQKDRAGLTQPAA